MVQQWQNTDDICLAVCKSSDESFGIACGAALCTVWQTVLGGSEWINIMLSTQEAGDENLDSA